LGGAINGAAFLSSTHNMNIEQQLNEIRERNNERLKDAINRLGTKYLLHPNNRVKKIKPKKGQLK
jgi:hypothetical protein